MLTRQTATSDHIPAAQGFNARQKAVLEEALSLLVEGGERGLTTAGLARKANCSKESLYKWFGDRDGLLAAMITYQASKVRVPEIPDPAATAEAFRRQLEGFAADLLSVLSGSTSLALNRLAIGQASREGSKLGGLLVSRGRRAIEQRAMRMLETGLAAGHLEFDDRAEAFEALYGLIVGERHVRMLLGDMTAAADEGAIAAQAQLAIDQFHRLYGAGERNTRTNTIKGRK